MTGVTGATGVSTGLAKTATKGNLDKAGKQFEAVFTGMMMKAMRQAKLADPLFDSKAIDTFRDMQDQQIATSMADSTPLGIGKAMTDFLSSQVPPEVPPASAPLPQANLNGSAPKS